MSSLTAVYAKCYVSVTLSLLLYLFNMSSLTAVYEERRPCTYPTVDSLGNAGHFSA